MFGALLWLFTPAWDAVKLTLKVGFICSFVVIDPAYLGATIVVAQALFLTIFNLSPLKIPAFLPMVIKLVCVTSVGFEPWTSLSCRQNLYAHALRYLRR